MRAAVTVVVIAPLGSLGRHGCDTRITEPARRTHDLHKQAMMITEAAIQRGRGLHAQGGHSGPPGTVLFLPGRITDVRVRKAAPELRCKRDDECRSHATARANDPTPGTPQAA